MKKCSKCGESKPISGFYKQPKMKDGHINKCKECTKRDVAERVAILSATDVQWVIAERERCRLKARRQRDAGTATISNAKLRTLRFRAANPEKYAAHRAVGNALRDGKLKRKPCEVCGNERAQAHHDDYYKPLSVRWFCTIHHNEHHIKERESNLRSKFFTK